MNHLIEIRHYVNPAGRDVFGDWLARLADLRTKAKIATRIDRLTAGNCGDSKSLGGGLRELRIDWGPGYRVYYAMFDRIFVVLLCGGTKENSELTLSVLSVISKATRKGHPLMKRKSSVSHDDFMLRELRKDPAFAVEYLKAALEDEDEPGVLLIALRRLAQARGIAKVAKAAGIERESLYRALSANGNPRLSTLVAVTKAIGLKLTVEESS
jgi:putative addiction module killer protein/probable addiction module antidote protein